MSFFTQEVPLNAFSRGHLVKTFYNEGLMLQFETERGTITIPATNHDPYFIVRSSIDAKTLSSRKGVIGYEKVTRRDRIANVDVDVYKIKTKHPKIVGTIRRHVEDAIEANIKYFHCYLMDKHIFPLMPYKFDGVSLTPLFDFDDLIDETFTSKIDVLKLLIKTNGNGDPEKYEFMKHFYGLAVSPIPPIKAFALDIECEATEGEPMEKDTKIEPMRKDFKIDAFSIYAPDFKIAFTTRKGRLSADHYYLSDEKALILEIFNLVKHLIKSNPIMLTFNGNHFDLAKINQRANELGILKESPFVDTDGKWLTVQGGVHLDLWQWYQQGGVGNYVYEGAYKNTKLDTIASALLGVRKEQIDYFNASANDYCSYCLTDTQLTYDLFEHQNRLAFTIISLLSRWCMFPIEEVIYTSIGLWMRAIFHSVHRDLNALIPTKYVGTSKRLKGALTLEPKVGIHFDVKVLDYASLYPSVIDVDNISYDTVNVCDHPECLYAEEIEVRVCQKRRGLLSLMIGAMKELRVRIFKPLRKDSSLFNAVQLFLKVLMNATYGLTGDIHQPSLYNWAVASFITWRGRESISKIADKGESMGIIVLYGDTDSIFLDNPTKEQVQQLIEFAENEMDLILEIDKDLKFLIISHKKNYLAVSHDDTFDVKGMSGMKRNTPVYIRNVFNDCAELITSMKSPDDLAGAKESITHIIHDAVLRLKSKTVPLDQLAFHITLHQDPEKRLAKPKVPQIYRVAEILMNRGVRVEGGSVVSFVKTKGKVTALPLRFVEPHQVDIKMYIENMQGVFAQLLDPMELVFPGSGEDSAKQLDGWF